MRKFDGWFVVSQPRYRVPCVFDLHQRGTFTACPPVTAVCGARMLVDEEFRLAVEYRYLVEDRGLQHGKFVSHVTRQGVFLLDETLALDLTAVHREVTSSEAIEEITRVYGNWCKDFLPLAADGTVDRAALGNKLRAALAEGRKQLRDELRRIHGGWIERRVAALTGGPAGWNRGATLEETYRRYQESGGADTPAGVFRKVAQFYSICDQGEQGDPLCSAGEEWGNEEMIWECWLAHAGGEEEAWRVMDALHEVIGGQRGDCCG